MAMLCLVAAKLATIAVPFILKHIVGSQLRDKMIALPLSLLLAYGVARLSTTLFSELHDTVFDRVIERTSRMRYPTLDSDLFDYIERFHNPRMRRRVARRDMKFSTVFKLSVETG